MSSSMIRLSLVCVAIASVISGARAQQIDASGIVENGNDHGAPACSACHGVHGEGMPASGFPRLAGLDQTYLARQLDDFAAGSRENETMAPIAKALTEQERHAVSAFYASAHAEKATEDAPADQKEVAAGAQVARYGDWAKGLPACGQCHGPDGQGVGAAFPRLSGQSALYVANQLAAWREGKRTNDPLKLMTGVAGKLSAEQAAAVAAYYASLPLTATATAAQKGQAQ